MQGKIIKGIAGFYYVHTKDEVIYECKAKGIFRNKKIKPLMFLNNKLFELAYMSKLLKKYRLDKFLTFKGNTYLRLVKMFYANIAMDDKFLVI